MTKENDIVLIYMENEPASFARVEEIRADVKRDWYVIKLLMLQIPLQVVSWILRAEYIDGAEFTMGGKSIRLEKIVCPEDQEFPESLPERESKEASSASSHSFSGKLEKQTIKQTDEKSKKNKAAPIISLADVRKQRNSKGDGPVK